MIVDKGLHYSIGFFVRSGLFLALIGMFVYTAVVTSPYVGFGILEIAILVVFLFIVGAILWHTAQVLSSRVVSIYGERCDVAYKVAGVLYKKHAFAAKDCLFTRHTGKDLGSGELRTIRLLHIDGRCIPVSVCPFGEGDPLADHAWASLGEFVKGSDLEINPYPNPAIWWP